MSSNGASNQEQHLRAQLELLQSHHDAQQSSPKSPASAARGSRDVSARPANGGYDDLRFTAQDAAARVLATKNEAESHIHPDLRATQEQHPPSGAMMQLAPHPDQGHNSPASAAPHQQQQQQQQQSGAAAAAAALVSAGGEQMMAMDAAADGRKVNKRELSQSKRAAQNRAAQRAFRQRKEGYIKKLEQQVREFGDVEMACKQYQSENYHLREYAALLQTRLLDSVGEFPPPPPNISITHPQGQLHPPPPLPPPPPPHHQQQQQQQHSSNEAQQQQQPGITASASSGTPLEAVAQAVAGLAAQEQLSGVSREPFPHNALTGAAGGGGSSAMKNETEDEDMRAAEDDDEDAQADDADEEPST